MIVPGWIISLVTFPGVIVHELAHQFFCRRMRVAVYDVRYFRLGNPAGYVTHESARTNLQNFMISIGPFFLNSILGFCIAFPSATAVLLFNSDKVLDVVNVLLGISIAMHAFPSQGDGAGIMKRLKRRDTPILQKILMTPCVWLIYLGSIGSMLWLDVVYGGVVCLLLPMLVIRSFA